MNQNSVSPNTQDISDLCPPCSDVKGMRPKAGRPLSRMSGLSERQLEHINTWLDEEVPYKKIVELCRTEFQVDIPKTTFQRYYRRSAARTLIADLADSKEAAAEISKFAVTGDPSFSANTLEILEQQAFDLAVAFNRDAEAEDFAMLEKVSGLVTKARNTKVRERHATVQEQKLELRREKFALERELALARLHKSVGAISPVNAPSAEPVCPSASSSRPDLNSTDAAPADPGAASPTTAVDSTIPAASDHTEEFDPENFPSISPNPLPPEVIARNLAFAKKLREGNIIIDRSGPYVRAVELSAIPAVDPSAVPQNVEAPNTNP